MDTDKPQEALDYLESNPTPPAESQSARATEAYLLSQLEQPDKAMKNFAALFAEGYRNDNYFVIYANLLSETRQQDVALAAVEDYLKENDSAAIRLLQARLYKQKKNFTKAIDLLKTQSLKYPYNAELTFSLADAYQQAGLYAESVEVCQQLINAQSEHGGGLLFEGLQ